MDAAEQFERDYAMGRLAGMTDALSFIQSVTENLPRAERELISDRVWGPLYEESKRQRAKRDAGTAARIAEIRANAPAGSAHGAPDLRTDEELGFPDRTPAQS